MNLCFKFISPGYVGVVVNLLGDKKGVEDHPIHVGMHWISPWKRVYTFPIFEQNDTWEDDDAFIFQTSEGLKVGAEIGLTFHLHPDEVPFIFQKYRRGMKEITHTFIRNYIRDAINNEAASLKIEEIYSTKKTEFLNHVQTRVREDLKELGFIISRIYLIDQLRLPPSVVEALNRKIAAIQRAEQRENELREAEADAKKKIAEFEGKAKCMIVEANAEAEANLIVSKSLTQDLIKWESIQKWDGRVSLVKGNSGNIIDISSLLNNK